MPDLRVAWAVGGTKYANADLTGGGTLYGIVTNTNSISIEMCDTIRNGVYQASEATMANAAALGRELMAKYNIPPANVVRHFDVTGKHCPSYLINAQKWEVFKQRLELEVETVTYKYLKDIPVTFRAVIELLMTAGIIQGYGSDPVSKEPMIDLTHEQVWTLVFVYRGGGFDAKLRAAGLTSAVTP